MNKIIKQNQSGYVAEHSAYHHGEQSLNQTIIGLAQNFCGSNNINLLVPCGQFGTRLQVQQRKDIKKINEETKITKKKNNKLKKERKEGRKEERK